jgi:hypothetical protein
MTLGLMSFVSYFVVLVAPNRGLVVKWVLNLKGLYVRR